MRFGSGWMNVAASLVSFGTAVAQAPSAQPPLRGRTPAACLQGANDAQNRMMMEARTSGRPLDYSKMRAELRRLAADCAGQFSISRIAPKELAELVNLYLFIGDTARAVQASDRSLSATGLTEREQGEAYLAAIRLAIAVADPFAGLVTRAEELTRRTDSLPDSLLDLKLSAHMRLLLQYEYADVDDGIRTQALTIFDILGRARRANLQLPQPAAQRAHMQAYLSLARSAADFLHPDSALAILDRAQAELGSTPEAQREIAETRALYALVGTRAAPVIAEHWINAPDTLTALTLGGGKVYLIQFTAHWCLPCRNSYPGFKRIVARFADSAFQAVLITDVYGIFDHKRVSVDEELAADRTYYREHWAIPFPVAIILPQAPGAAPAVRGAVTDSAYRVNGIPQIVVVDKRGIIRQVVSGWDKGNEDRLTRLIEQLEREPGS